MIFYIKKLFYKLFKILPIKNNKVLIFSYYGANYGGSPKYLSEYFCKNASELDIVWAFCDTQKYEHVNDVKKVKYSSVLYYYHLATAHFIITNYRMTEEFNKRSNQKYIQTWHSSLRLKMIEKDAETTLPAHYVQMAKKDSTQIDLLLAGSQKSKNIYERSFWYNGEYLNCGTPQCVIFFNKNNHIVNKVYDYFKIAKNKKILLYAPTFRKNHDLSVYDIDYDRLLNTLKEEYKSDWVILLRLHPHLINNSDSLEFNESILNATQYDDIQELLCAADIVITDYSALMFDYSLTKKPCFLYMNDYESYISQDRNLYFDIKQLPFPACFNNDDLNNQIKYFSINNYIETCNNFLMNEVETYDDGKACQRVLEYIRGEL